MRCTIKRYETCCFRDRKAPFCGTCLIKILGKKEKQEEKKAYGSREKSGAESSE